MSKILYIITQSELGGAQKNVLDLAAGLKENYDILVAVGTDGYGLFFDLLKKKNIRFVKLRWLRRSTANPFVDLAGLWEIFWLIKKEKPEIVHLHSSKAGFSGALASKIAGVKVIYTVHGAVFEASFSWLNKKFYLWLEKISSRFKDKIICVSENDKKLWLKYNAAPENKLVVIHNGLDYQALDFLPKDEAREKLFAYNEALFKAARGSSANLKIIGSIANFYPEKGLPYLIQAAGEIMEKIPELLFIVIGEGFERPLLEKMIQEYGLSGRFILTGALNEAWRLLKAFDVYTLPSTKEGFPYVILEAMAAGLPIVASYIGGIPEMIENGKNGFLISPKNSEMLADRLEAIIRDERLAGLFSENSRQKIQYFSLQKMLAETKNVYESVL